MSDTALRPSRVPHRNLLFTAYITKLEILNQYDEFAASGCNRLIWFILRGYHLLWFILRGYRLIWFTL